MVYGETAMVRFNLSTMNGQTRKQAINALDLHSLPTGHAVGQGNLIFPFCCMFVLPCFTLDVTRRKTKVITEDYVYSTKSIL